MNAKEFISKNQDILVAPITQADFQNLSDGYPVFCITVSTGNKPPMDRAVKSAGYQLVVATTRYPRGTLADISTLGLTKNGYAKVENITANDIAIGRVLLFRCRPLPVNDIRRNHHWFF